MNIPGVRKISDIAATEYQSVIKSSKDGLIYIWGELRNLSVENLVCEYTNIFDVCNVKTGQSPISMNRVYTDEETSILDDLAAAFNDRVSLIPCFMCSSIFPFQSFQSG